MESAAMSEMPVEHVDPDQDAAAIQQVAQEIGRILTPNEQILYIALQGMTTLSLKKDSAVATTNRLILYRPAMLGRVDFTDYLWEDVDNVTLKDGMLSSELSVESSRKGNDVATGLDKNQARRLYAVCQQKEQEWREKRRVRQMEEDRARAGGIYMQPSGGTASADPAEDPVAKLGRAKAMLDQGLISEQEYETVKARILSEM
jgi:hypothetical protein